MYRVSVAAKGGPLLAQHYELLSISSSSFCLTFDSICFRCRAWWPFLCQTPRKSVQMPPPPKGPVSGFAAAAKVLFDSAQRVGAVEPLGHSSKEYAQQLKKIQSHSKRRGGSLGGVSYKVSEFLAAQRVPTPQQAPSGPFKERSIAKKVPLIEIPSIQERATAEKHPATERVVRAPLDSPPSLRSLFSTRTEASTTAVPVLPPSPTPLESESAAPASPPVEDVLITEDKPIFEFRQQVAQQPAPEAVVQRSAVSAANQGSSTPARKSKPVISIPIASVGAAVEEAGGYAAAGDSSPDAAGTPMSAGFSVDMWEQQRERELERLQKKQEEEEQRRLMLMREQEHQTLGKEWVMHHTYKVSFEAELTVGGKLLRELFAADSASAAVLTFQKMIDAGARASTLLPAGLASVAYSIRCAHPTERQDLRRQLLDVAVKAKLPDHVMRKAHLLLSGGTDFLAAFSALTEVEKQHLDSRIILKAIQVLMWNERWEEALKLAKESRSNFHRGSEMVDLALLKASQLLEEGPRKEVVGYASQSLTENGRMSVRAKLLIASAERGAYRRTLLKQLTVSSDVDESIYAELFCARTRARRRLSWLRWLPGD
ncbi:hypothetical protein, conserved [Leishmania tarentolae]|uniref:Uncharacterized protein n=1 Tax=Leishmania tarentolae TaxID=5689 RepID=A0A640KR24_LEITA|nr:hypothetical protein, conserved [Leishmania tarentolae]